MRRFIFFLSISLLFISCSKKISFDEVWTKNTPQVLEYHLIKSDPSHELNIYYTFTFFKTGKKKGMNEFSVNKKSSTKDHSNDTETKKENVSITKIGKVEDSYVYFEIDNQKYILNSIELNNNVEYLDLSSILTTTESKLPGFYGIPFGETEENARKALFEKGWKQNEYGDYVGGSYAGFSGTSITLSFYEDKLYMADIVLSGFDMAYANSKFRKVFDEIVEKYALTKDEDLYKSRKQGYTIVFYDDDGNTASYNLDMMKLRDTYYCATMRFLEKNISDKVVLAEQELEAQKKQKKQQQEELEKQNRFNDL